MKNNDVFTAPRKPTKRWIKKMNIRPSQDWVTGSVIRIVQEDTSRALIVGRKDMIIVDAKND